ncbi:tetratricopeptide repeat protein [Streptomyces sp. NPDC047042]|uniref:WD40 repeat domain-containing protein n=1 Tax=Streptomyces sp. NPDC047042 TaxID=3154807 RepID=UPI0033D4A073
MEDAERRELLAAVRRALRREAGVLAVSPELTWQQLYNQLQWSGSAATTVLERERQRQPPTRTWFWVQSPPADSQALIAVLGQTNSPFAFAPDGSTLIIVHAGYLRYVNVLTGMPTRTIELVGGTTQPVRGCAVSPDGSFMASATEQALRLWRLPTGESLRTLRSGEPADESDGGGSAQFPDAGPKNLVVAQEPLPCAISPDASYAVGSGPDHAIKIWDTASGQLRASFSGHTGPVTTCAVSMDGSLVVSASHDGTLRLWNPSTGWLGTIVAVSYGGRRRHPAAAPGSATDPNSEVPRQPGAKLSASEVVALPVNGCAIGPDASFLVAVSEDQVTVWDLPSGQVRWSQQHLGGARSCAISPDGAFVVSGGERGDLRLWDVTSGTELTSLTGHTGSVDVCAVGPDATVIASRAEDGIRLWDGRARGEQESLAGHGKRITACRFDATGEYLASAAADSSLVVWEADGRRRIASLEGHDDVVQDCAFTPDGTQLVSASRDRTVRVWDAHSGTEQRLFKARRPVWGCSMRPDGGAVLFGWDKRPALWDLQTGHHLMEYEAQESGIWRCAFSPDGTWTVTSGDDGTLTVHDSESGAKRAKLTGHADTAGVCAVSPDGAFIVSGGVDRTVRIWDTEPFRQRYVLNGHTDAVWGCAVSPDARIVASVSWDGSLRVWDAQSGREQMCFELPHTLHALAFHPWQPVVALGDRIGWLHRVELVGLDFGPVVVTAYEADGALLMRCPACHFNSPVTENALGNGLACPACNMPVRLSKAILQPLPKPGAGRGQGRVIAVAQDDSGVDERALELMNIMRTCFCGTQFELLRYACPNCGSSWSFSTGDLPVEAIEFRENRQSLSALHVSRGATLANRGQHEEALEEYGKAIQANPWNATAHQNVGTAMWRLGDLTEALRWYEEALRLDPRRALPAKMATLIRQIRGLEEQARTDLESGQPDNALANLTAAADLCAETAHRQQIEQVIRALSAE